VQSLVKHGIALLAGTEFTAALNLKELVVGTFGASSGLIWLIKSLKGRKPEKITKTGTGTVRITLDGESFDVPLKLLRLYQDLAVRSAVERVVRQPLEKPGIDHVRFLSNKRIVASVGKEAAQLYSTPEVEEKTLIDDRRRAAYSIVALAFKEDNKWRLHDGNNQINVLIKDGEFLNKINNNMISFSKGDVLICDVKVSQKQTKTGLATEYVVEHVVEHIPAARQLQFVIEEPEEEPPLTERG
jgi:hypothetical protein